MRDECGGIRLEAQQAGQAYIIWRGNKRLAIFPYGKDPHDVKQETARKLAMSLYNALEQKGEAARVNVRQEAQKRARYIDVPTSGGKWAVMDTTRTHNVNVAVFSTEGEAMACASHLNRWTRKETRNEN